ncbi:MAG: hypothetical protein LYZ70_04275 [Nitrososphaerales archaeon]|nr:hypothetical protein [Nitrososphaerales archaeon]
MKTKRKPPSVQADPHGAKPWRISEGYRTYRFRSEDLVEAGIRENDKCGGCNWEVTFLYVMATSEKSAVKLLRSGDAGLCGNCYSDMLADVPA